MQELSSCLTAGCTLFTKTCLNKSVRTGSPLGTPPLTAPLAWLLGTVC